MTIDVRGIPSGGALHAHAIKRLTAIVKRLATAPVEAQAKFFDDNGPRGGRAMRCALTVRLPYRSHVRVEHTAETTRLAFRRNRCGPRARAGGVPRALPTK